MYAWQEICMLMASSQLSAPSRAFSPDSRADSRCARAGRVASKRRMGKLVFYDIKADGEKVQAMAAADNSPLDEAGFVTLHNRHAATAPAL